MNKIILYICLFLSFSIHAQVSIFPDHPAILYTGRFAFSDPLNPSFSLNGTSIKANFTGTNITARLSNSGVKSYVYIIIDNQADPYNRKVIEVASINEQAYVLADNLDNTTHSIEIIKLNESDSKITFHGLLIEGTGINTKPERPPLQLEFIGDSNTAGWSAWDAYDNGGAHNSGSYYTFPGIVSRLLNAEYSLIGGSGSGVTDKASWNLTKVYDRIHLSAPPSTINTWNFQQNYWNFQPAAVVVNLGANDYYANASKQEIKDGWKKFIQDKLRMYYPNAHIVLANSYGWAYREPADYVQEAIAELKNAGEENISFIRFPWLWGQAHAVIGEHAGFANLLATHLAKELNLAPPTLSNLSSFVDKGVLYNGGFEKSILPGMADACRPHGQVALIADANLAFDGNNCLELKTKGWANFTTEVNAGDSLILTAWAKAAKDAHSGYLRIEFKDQAQKTIKTQQIQPDFKTEWTKFKTATVAPEGVWSAWVVMAAENNSTVYFDKLQLNSATTSIYSPLQNSTPIKIFPNPTADYVYVSPPKFDRQISIFSASGELVQETKGNDYIDVRDWEKGVYFMRVLEENFIGKFVKY